MAQRLRRAGHRKEPYATLMMVPAVMVDPTWKTLSLLLERDNVVTDGDCGDGACGPEEKAAAKKGGAG
jgi:hypothetical protein